jgi:hypothetical protein
MLSSYYFILPFSTGICLIPLPRLGFGQVSLSAIDSAGEIDAHSSTASTEGCVTNALAPHNHLDDH